jgi:hypothetical protein
MFRLIPVLSVRTIRIFLPPLILAQTNPAETFVGPNNFGCLPPDTNVKKIIAIVACTALFAGCEVDELEAIADRASATGSLESSSSLIERYYYIQKYKASAQQTLVAQENGSEIVHRSKRKLPKYVAVSTAPDARSKGKASVMIFNTTTEQVVGKNVYDLAGKPKENDQIKSDQLTVPFERPNG